MIIGITGKSGSGKSILSNYFKDFHIVNIDEIGHKVLKFPYIQEEIIKNFNIDLSKTSRKDLGDIVFNNRHEMKKLTDITWTDMEKLIQEEINNHKNIVLDWILLPHTDFFNICDIKILIKSDLDKRKDMVFKRDNINKNYFEKRENSSIEYDEKSFDYILLNDYNIKTIKNFYYKIKGEIK